VIEAATIAQLALRLNVPVVTLGESLSEVEAAKRGGGADRFGRSFAGGEPLTPPFKAVKVTGALFHTQGGLAVEAEARVLATGGRRLPNLFAAGGAAAGVSGSHASGYLSGNGLLTATVLGRVAGRSAAALVTR
jgi:fumarate reductase flavoprotein subunit